jgi:uncharacterized cupredoxin-like copper-binding protein
MRRTALPTLLVAIMIFGGACGTSPSAGQMPSQSASPTSSTGSSGGSGSTRSNQVDVTLADNTITSSLTTFQVGVPYTFVIKNNGNHLHNFNIAQPVSVTGSEDASLSSALLAVTQDKLPIGGGTTVQFTFPASAVDMQLEFSCLIRRHYEDGMRLAITVTK